jgi:Arc/MetJ-type ribon-helix-helix transcriptional regulator
MAKTKTISLWMPSELAETIREAVRSGEFASKSAVVREALELWIDERRKQGGATDAAPLR